MSAVAVPTAEPDAARAMVNEAERAWRAAVRRGEDAPRPWPLAPVHRIWANRTLDLRTGLMTNGEASPRDLMMFALAQLPLVRELTEEPS